MTPEERKAFLREHRLAVVGVERRNAPPQLSPVYYVMDGDPGQGLRPCVAPRGYPFASSAAVGRLPYLTVYGRGRIEADGAVGVMMSGR